MILDLIVAIVIVVGFYLGYSRGLIKTVFNSLSLIIGILAALKLSPVVMDIIQSVFSTSPAVSFLLGVVVTFLGVMYLIRYISTKFEDILKAVNINFINKIAGGTLQALFYAYLLSLTLWMVDGMSLLKPEVKQASITYSLLEPLPEKGRAFFTSLKPIFKSFWDKTVESMDSIKGE
ncbi:MAG TPA: CvpA family protein [Saprospiraceae bacterium]|nr:CvpA family protein [Saprospiraceae bacterium]HRO07705.1 CvpA family protein [Saprospiraceae bacterium]HRO72527.1 CvpA family protein [Saprospiraceae bacterium]HRP41070.1 CvpA family protein [Saprospiraceae bacterium]